MKFIPTLTTVLNSVLPEKVPLGGLASNEAPNAKATFNFKFFQTFNFFFPLLSSREHNTTYVFTSHT